MKLKPIEMVLVALFAALMGVGANLTAFLTVGSVPITFQAFIAILAGTILGKRLGALSIIIYLLVGLAGMPIFSKFSGGFSAFVSPTFGFLLSFVLSAYLSGRIVEHKQSPRFPTFLFASFVGLGINYVLGTHYMFFAMHYIVEAPIPYSVLWLTMSAPFIKDVIFTVLAAMIAQRMYPFLKKRHAHLRKSSTVA